ncbi:hypothetical protein D9M68_816000 [compost metagenome]
MADGVGGAAHAAAGEGAHACFEFLQRERLGHVVVGAVVQALDAFLDGVGRREDQHRHLRAARAQLAQHLQPVHPGQAQVEDQQVELVVGHQRGVGLGAARHMVDGGARRAQAAQKAVGEHLVVFGDEDPHACLLEGVAPSWRALLRRILGGGPCRRLTRLRRSRRHRLPARS